MGLSDDPFDWSVTKNGEVRISRGGRVVSTVRGAAADRPRSTLDAAAPDDRQQLLARATGNYRRGNERRPRRDQPR